MENTEIIEEITSKYDPTKEYEWDQEDSFTITGREFAILYNGLNLFLSNPLSFASMKLPAECLAVINNMLRTYVDQDKVREKSKINKPEEDVHTMD